MFHPTRLSTRILASTSGQGEPAVSHICNTVGSVQLRSNAFRNGKLALKKSWAYFIRFEKRNNFEEDFFSIRALFRRENSLFSNCSFRIFKAFDDFELFPTFSQFFLCNLHRVSSDAGGRARNQFSGTPHQT
jgi:hypothetical protein